MAATEKLQKVLAACGLGSRRELERWIEAGRVSVDGSIAKLGDRVTSSAKIRVDGHLVKRIPAKEQKTRVLLYHKPIGEVCTRSDPDGRPTVFDQLPHLSQGRWILVGRLDVNTVGLLFFTNDGELAHRLMHPSSEIEREYAVRVLGEVDEALLKRLRQGVQLEDGAARFKSIRLIGGSGANVWYHVVLTEGRHREVRRLWESQGVKVSRLIRVRFGSFALPKMLKPGHWIDLSPGEICELYDLINK